MTSVNPGRQKSGPVMAPFSVGSFSRPEMMLQAFRMIHTMYLTGVAANKYACNRMHYAFI